MSEEEVLKRLQVYITARFMGVADVTTGGCGTCGYGGEESLSFDGLQDLIREFAKDELKIKL